MTNDVRLTGNTSRDGATLRFTPSGAAVCNFRGAFQNSKLDKQTQQWVDDGEPLWLDVTAWNEVAEKAAEEIGQGQSARVTVTGHLRARSYETKEGEKRTVHEVAARTVYVHPPRVRQANDTGAPGWGGGQQQSGGWVGQQQRPQQQSDPWGQPATDEPPF